MDTQDWYTVNEFAPGTFQVTEGGRFNMFFIVGNERALALDGGIGIGGLCRLYESITDLPIDFVLTHTHWDHVGAASQWDKIGVHPNGKGQLANDLSNFCQGFLKGWDKPLPQGFDPASYNIKPPVFGWEVKEGDVIDLGGRRLRVYDTPGHSPCSISLLDDKEGVLISGDLARCKEVLFMQVPTAVLSDYAPSLRKLEKLAGEVKWICSGHTPPYPDASILGEMAAFVEEIEAGKHEPPKKADGGNWGEVDEYEAPCCKVWIQDHARK